MTFFFYLSLGLLFVILLGVLFLRTWPQIIERQLNKVALPPPYPVSEPALQVHKALFIADLHADSLLWSRDLLERGEGGHVDLPRLQDGNLAFQVFGVVTRFSLGHADVHSATNFDLIGPLTAFQGWPAHTWGSRLQRALYQAERLSDFASRSNGQLRLVGSLKELDAFLEDRAANPSLIGAFLGLEGVHALEGDLQALDQIFQAGFRMVGLTHFSDNPAGGSSSGVHQGGLTDWGRAVVEKAQSLGMIVDLAHASTQLLEDVLALAGPPVVVSHGGILGACGFKRNLTDALILKIAAQGGVVGVTFYETLICGRRVADTARSVKYLIDRFGEDCVALGTDFDGAIMAPVDVSGLPLLTEALLDLGLQPRALEKFYGGNFLRVVRAALPQE